MVALVVGLKWRLLRGSWRADVWQVVGSAAAAVVGLLVALGGAVAVVALRAADAVDAQRVLVGGGFLLVVAWALVPLLAFGVDETLDPARFALLPVRGRDLVPGLTVAALVGVPGASTAIVVLATLATWARGPLPLLLAVVCVPIALATCIVLSRLLTTLGARALSTRRARETGATIGVLLVSGLGIVPVVISTQVRRVGDLTAALDVLAWTPPGWVWAVPGDLATGHVGRGLLRLLLAAGLVAVAGWGWGRLLDRALTSQSSGGGSATRRRGPDGPGGRRPLLERLPDGPATAVMVRCLRYWRRDARYVTLFSSVIIASVVPAVAIRAAATDGAPTAILLAGGPFIGMLIGLSASNDLGYDGTAFATHLLTGVPGWADRLGRLLALLVWAVPAVAALSVAGAVLGGRPGLAPGLVGVAEGMLLGSLAAASVGGALAPYPMPEPGANPFRANSGGSARAVLAQLACGSVAFATATPAATALVVAALGWWPPGVWLALLAGPVLGAGVLAIGVRAGGSVIDQRGPEILSSVRRPQ